MEEASERHTDEAGGVVEDRGTGRSSFPGDGNQMTMALGAGGDQREVLRGLRGGRGEAGISVGDGGGRWWWRRVTVEVEEGEVGFRDTATNKRRYLYLCRLSITHPPLLVPLCVRSLADRDTRGLSSGGQCAKRPGR